MKLTLAIFLVFSPIAAAQEPRSEEESKVRTTLDAFGKAMADRDKDAVLPCFNLSRMLKEFEIHGGMPFLSKGEEAREDSLRRLRLAFPAMATGMAAAGLPWEKVRTLNVQLKPAADEAEALCHVTMGGVKNKFRFFLFREKGDWKIYDFESPGDGLRFSLTMGTIASSVAGDSAAARSLQKGLGEMIGAVKPMTEGDFVKAREKLARARAANLPGDVGAWVEFLDTVALLGLEKPTEALQAADRALAIQKDLTSAHFLKATAYSGLGEHAKAIASAREFIRKAGDDPDVWELIGKSHEELDQQDEAIQAYRKGAACDDEDFTNRLAAGRLLLVRGKAVEAKPFLLAASKNASPEEDTFEEAAQLLADAKEYATVLELSEERIKRTPDDSGVLLWQGRSLRKLSRLAEAEKILGRGMDKEPENLQLLEELVCALAQGGKDEKALEHAKAFEKEAPLTARYLRLFVHAAAGRLDRATEELATLLGEDPDQINHIENELVFGKLLEREDARKLAQAARAKLDYDREAEKLQVAGDWENLLKISRERATAAPGDGDALYHQGAVLRHLKQFEDSEKILKEALKKVKEPLRVKGELARTLAARGQVQEALTLADTLEAEPAILLRAAIHAIAKNTDLALKALDQLFEKDAEYLSTIEGDADFKELLKTPACQELLKKVRKKE